MGETTTRLMTVEEFRKLPETGPFYYELRHGELVPVTRPKLKHLAQKDKSRDYGGSFKIDCRGSAPAKRFRQQL